MRSRYCAYALKLFPYLLATDLHATELITDDGAHRRYVGLRIIEVKEDEVLFHAKIYERGEDVSFTERSKFVRTEKGWLYASGEIT